MKTRFVLAMMLFSTTVLADSHNEKKAPAAKTDAAKKDTKAPEAKKEAPPAAAMPTPPAELAAMMKMMSGNWKCTGKGAMDPANPAAMTEFKGTYKAALDLDKFWIKGDWAATAGKVKMKGVIYTTYDASSKKWHRIMIDNMGMSGWESSAGLPAGTTEGKVVWEGESRMMGQNIKGRSTEEVSAKSMKLTGEMSPDGKKWVTGMEMTCTK